MPIVPEPLIYGDTVGILAPASPPADPRNIDRSVEAINRLGFKAKLARHARKRHGFLAGSDRERADDLMRLMTDPKVKAVVCLRGGYGSGRLLPLLDYPALRAHPKILVGHSDVTALHCALLSRANLVSFHGPMLHSDFIKEDMPDFTLQSFLRILMQPAPAGAVCQGYTHKTLSVLRGGRASGRLLGGNLTLLCSLLGTPFQPVFRNTILFFEDIGEKPYRIDRLLTQLLNAGLLQQVAGIAIGINKDCVDPDSRQTTEYRQTLEDVFRERLLPLKVPIVAGLPFGHVSHNATLPLGVRATLDGEAGDLLITEPAVRKA
jgi:muramoyltetrapeptide carboxypeptidase